MPDFETDVVHAGVSPEPVTGAVMTPIFQSSTFQQISPGKHKGYEYTRTGNPTRTVLETQLAALERGDKALCFSSGTSAEDAVLNMLDSGDHVVTCDDLYGGTRRLFTRVAAHRGIRFTFVDARDLNEVEAAFEHKTKIVWVESPTNPLQNVFDIRKIADLAASHGAISLVDNTFLSPYFQRPLELGADIALHSMTKYLNGHSDVVMGAVIVSKTPRAKIAPDDRGDSLYTKLKFLQNAVGAVPRKTPFKSPNSSPSIRAWSTSSIPACPPIPVTWQPKGSSMASAARSASESKAEWSRPSHSSPRSESSPSPNLSAEWKASSSTRPS